MITLCQPSVFPTSKYSVDQSYSISDKSLVPAPLQSSCAGIPLHWLEHVVRATVHGRLTSLTSIVLVLIYSDILRVGVGVVPLERSELTFAFNFLVEF